MRRFRPRPTKPGRLWPWLLIWLVLVVAYLVWVGWPQNQTEGATLNQASTRTVGKVAVSYTGSTWHGKPVYRLRNTGPVLSHVNVYNWAENELPVLYVGFSAPNNLFTLKSPARPPYEVPHLASLWFVSSSTPPATFTITWDEQGNVQYTTVQVPKTTNRRASLVNWQPNSFVVH